VTLVIASSIVGTIFKLLERRITALSVELYIASFRSLLSGKCYVISIGRGFSLKIERRAHL
jgi:hypothetical protein